MFNSRIDWCDSTWNPITGCLHGCEYCYAREIAERFGTADKCHTFVGGHPIRKIHILDEPAIVTETGKKTPYPFGFETTFHRYRLNDYIDKKGRNIFVCSMADLFGRWVSDEWIQEVFAACEKAPQHNYLFLTKNPQRYVELAEKGFLRCSNNMWYGWSEVSNNQRPHMLCFPCHINTFVSIEPILEPVRPSLEDWIIVGAEAGGRKDKVIPKRKWIEQIVEDCKKFDIPLFMKSSLADIWGEPLIQEFPKELKRSVK